MYIHMPAVNTYIGSHTTKDFSVIYTDKLILQCNDLPEQDP